MDIECCLKNRKVTCSPRHISIEVHVSKNYQKPKHTFLFPFVGLQSFHSYIIVCMFMKCKLIMHTTKGYVFKVACNECSAKMKKCLVCGELITEKVVIIISTSWKILILP